MDQDFEDLLKQGRQIAQHLAVVYRDITGEEIDLESAIRHYPITMMGLALGVGALGGWYFARRSQPKLPPPQAVPPARDLLPESLEKFRELLPGMVPEDAAETAKEWLEDVVEPRLKEGMESMMATVSETRFGLFLRQTIQRLESGEDREIEDPEEDA